MLTNRQNVKMCMWCAHASPLPDGDMLCRRHGAVGEYHRCRKYIYDPFKRIPPRPKLPQVMPVEEVKKTYAIKP